MLRLGVVGMRGSTVIRLPPYVTSGTSPPPPLAPPPLSTFRYPFSRARCFYQDDAKAWREEAFALLLEAWVEIAEDSEVTSRQEPSLRKGVEDATFPLYEQYFEHEMTIRWDHEGNGRRLLLPCSSFTLASTRISRRRHTCRHLLLQSSTRNPLPRLSV